MKNDKQTIYKSDYFGTIKIQSIQTISDDCIKIGVRDLKIVKKLKREKQYKQALIVLKNCWTYGYFVPATYKEIAIIARKIKKYPLEIEILKIYIVQLELDYKVPGFDKKIEWARNRLKKSIDLSNKQ